MNCLLTCFICFSALLGLSSCAILSTLEDGVPKSERDLREHLFRGYDKLVRPVKNPDNQIEVSVSLSLIRVRDLNAKDVLLVLETFTLFTWVDEYLKWDAEQFGNISVLRVPASEVWRPDLAVYTSPEQSEMFAEPLTNVLVYDSGKVLWVPMFTIKSKCPLVRSSKKTVTCNIKIGSWTFHEYLLDVQLKDKGVDLSDFQDINPEWKLVGVVSDRVQKYYPCCNEPYPHLDFNVTLQRRNHKYESTTLKDYDFDL